MRIAIVGCGFVSDYYVSTLPNYPELELVGMLDRDCERARRCAAFWNVPHVYETLEELLADKQVEIVLNLTNPRSHYEVSRACLLAGKHVYSEKPLATAFADAEELVRLAAQCGLRITSAPCNCLGETAQTLWKALREGVVGRVHLVYAELDDGLIHRMRYRNWINPSGNPWPYKDEFEVGCTLEHAGYYVTWLACFFGPARQVTAFASCQIPDKRTDAALDVQAPDFSVACIEFQSGVVARLTCSIIAPHDHALRIFGEEGILSCEECWNYGSPVYLKRRTKLSLWAEKHKLLSLLPGIGARRLPLVRRPQFRSYRATHRMDFARGPAELAASIAENRPCRMSAEFALHVNEIVLAIQNPAQLGCPRTLVSTFAPPEPLPWALGASD